MKPYEHLCGRLLIIETFGCEDKDYYKDEYSLEFFHLFSRNIHLRKLYCTCFLPVNPSPDHKVIKLLTFDNLFPPL